MEWSIDIGSASLWVSHSFPPPPTCVTVSFNPFSPTTRYKCHQNKVRVKGLGRNGSYMMLVALSMCLRVGSGSVGGSLRFQ